MPTPEPISRDVARRYLLGRQGLWPGRRWTGREGAAAAINALEALQMDSVQIVARSHDLVLWSRVAGYQPSHLADLLYRDRAFFDYGSHLDIYPISELPYWRLHMRRRLAEGRYATFAAANGPLLAETLHRVREQGPLNAKDLPPGNQVDAWSYRGTTDIQLALYNLWIAGELMTHERRGFERVYDVRQRIVPPALDYEADEAAAEQFFAAKALRLVGLGTLRAWTAEVQYAIGRRLDRAEARRWLTELEAGGEAASVTIEGMREPHYLPAAHLLLIAQLAAGEIPAAWRPAGTTTADEAVFLSPLDNLLRRDRTSALFDFTHIWEIYKPAAKRRWGAYTMPVLFGDRLVARIEPKLERKTGLLRIDGLWLENELTAADPGFAVAVARGLDHFAAFHTAARLDLTGIPDPALRAAVRAATTTPAP